MLVGVLSDIHANRIALDAVLDDMPDVDAMVCAGDVVGYNPWPAECVDEMRSHDVPTVMGNHDRAVVTETGFGGNGMADAGVRYALDVLDDDRIEWLAGLPESRYCFDGRVRIVHGHPDDPNRYTYPSLFSARLLGEEDVLIMGHTHVQAHERFDEGIVLNPGSVGQPRDGEPTAAYALVDLEAMTVSERRVEYDIESVIEEIEAVGLPEATGARLRKGR
ncbi:metallophosphoesterase family protein [Natronomonas salsuginis]|jgi:putative phosphoesterase|uniref:Phosphoesterase n=1 Tax=Natronomonas salsuginis TaxID=2217661 RepID=A0A4U5JD70_9EURY|nr:YfcE family phosphodiesterase [Natronomonas salsuginis]TKR25778.1 metallophosphoesterase family protein [Natronomonas salsuginis]